MSKLYIVPTPIGNLKDITLRAIDVLKDVDGLGFSFFNPKDVVRHPLVKRIVEAYDAHDEKQPK